MENLVFIILNILFLILLVLFLLRQGEGAIVLEQAYAKEVSLLIDSAKPGTTMLLNIEKGKKLADKNNVAVDDIIQINNNMVTVKLSESGGYSYSFFNDVDASTYPDTTDPLNIKDYVIKINNYKNE